jgi:hypothetical protein
MGFLGGTPESVTMNACDSELVVTIHLYLNKHAIALAQTRIIKSSNVMHDQLIF